VFLDPQFGSRGQVCIIVQAGNAFGNLCAFTIWCYHLIDSCIAP